MQGAVVRKEVEKVAAVSYSKSFSDNSNDRGSRSTVLRSSSFKDRIRVDKFHQGAVLHRGLFSKVVQGQSFSDRGVKDRNGKFCYS